MSSTPAKSLRLFSRVPFDAAVQLHLHDRTLNVHLIDIALKGALVSTETLQAVVPMEKCRLVMPLTEAGEGIVMKGQVVHLENLNIGIECLDIDVVSLTQLRRLLELNTGDGELMKRELAQLFARRTATL